MRSIISLLIALMMTGGGPAQAQPHFYIDVSNSIRYNLDGKALTGDLKNDPRMRASYIRWIVASAIAQLEVGGVRITPWHEKLATSFYVQVEQPEVVEAALRQRIYSYGLPTKLGASLEGMMADETCQSLVIVTDDYTYKDDAPLLKAVLDYLLEETTVTILMLPHPGAADKMELYRNLINSPNYRVEYLTVANVLEASKTKMSNECPMS